MTGPNPIQVIQTKGVGQELLDAITPLIQTIQHQRDLEERRLELEQQKEELKLRKSDLQFRQEDRNHKLMVDEQTGALLKAMAAIGEAGSAGPAPVKASVARPQLPLVAP